MKRAKKAVAKRPRGRPPKVGANLYSIKISGALADKAARIGEQDGKPNMTRGIEMAIERFVER